MQWYRLWNLCHENGLAGPMLRAWPDGKSLLEQPALTVRVFEMIDEQVALEARQQSAIQEAQTHHGKRN